jgi:glutaredoxin-related protein
MGPCRSTLSGRTGSSLIAPVCGYCTRALERLSADEELFAIVGSWGDTLDDAEILSRLKDYNAGRPTIHPRQ